MPSTVERLVERVNSRELDLAYFFAFDGQRVPDSEIVRVEPLALFVSPKHPLAQLPVVTPEDVRATPAIQLGPDNLLRKLVDRALEQAGVGGSPIALETDEYGLMLTWLQRNHGFACMFTSVTEDSQTSGLVSLHLENPLPALQVCRLMRHSARHDPLAQALGDALTKRMKEVA
jgi:DNA-binding transcriptional LysR family regulator